MFQKINLEMGVCYTATIGNLKFGNLNQKILIKLFSDGRICGRMVEPLLAGIFNDFSCSVGGNLKFDLVRVSNVKLKQEIKTFTPNGCKLIPSSQIGKGRTYNKAEYHERVKKMESYIVVDIRTFPNIKIVAWPSKHILKNYPDGRKVSDDIFKTKQTINLGIIK